MRTFRSGAHIARVDPMTGVGLLVCPLAEHDVMLSGETSLSLHAADWDAMVSRLAGDGWDILADDDGMPIQEDVCEDGRRAISLYGLDPIASLPTFLEIGQAHAELVALAREGR